MSNVSWVRSRTAWAVAAGVPVWLAHTNPNIRPFGEEYVFFSPGDGKPLAVASLAEWERVYADPAYADQGGIDNLPLPSTVARLIWHRHTAPVYPAIVFAHFVWECGIHAVEWAYSPREYFDYGHVVIDRDGAVRFVGPETRRASAEAALAAQGWQVVDRSAPVKKFEAWEEDVWRPFLASHAPAPNGRYEWYDADEAAYHDACDLLWCGQIGCTHDA